MHSLLFIDKKKSFTILTAKIQKHVQNSSTRWLSLSKHLLYRISLNYLNILVGSKNDLIRISKVNFDFINFAINSAKYDSKFSKLPLVASVL